MKLSMIRAVSGILLILTLLVIPVTAALADTPWPKFGGDLNNTGQSAFTGAQSATLKWMYSTGSNSYASPVFGSDGTVYIGSANGFYALDPNGTVKWSYDAKSASTASVGSDGTIYVSGSAGRGIFALNPDGTLKWNFYPPATSYPCSSTIGSDEIIYVVNGTGYLTAMNPDGTQKWVTQLTSTSNANVAPAIDPEGTIYVAAGSSVYGDAVLSAVNPDGSLKWQYPSAGSLQGPTVIGPDNTIYIADSVKNVTALNPDGTVKWQYNDGVNAYGYGSLAIGADGTIYTGSTQKNVIALNPDGTLKWYYLTGGAIRGAPTIGADGTIYIGNNGDRKAYALNPDGSLNWIYTIGSRIDATPAIGSDGTVYFPSSGGIYAFAGVVSFTADQPAGAGPLTVQFTGISPLTVTAWNWDFGDGTTSADQNPSHTYSSIGHYTVNLSITHADGTNYLRQTDYIRVFSPPVADFTADATSGVFPLTISFTDISTGNPTSWEWDFGDSTTSINQHPLHTYSTAGTYTVNLTATNAGGSNLTSKAGYISVLTPTIPVASFTASKRAGLAPVTVQFNDTSTWEPKSWLWDFGDGTTSTDRNATHTYTTIGIYTVNLTATNAAGSNTNSRTSYIAVLDQQPFSNYRFLNVYVANDEGVKYDVPDGVYASGGAYTYVPNTYWVMFRSAGGGVNAMHISPTSNAWSSSAITSTTNQSGSFWITFSGGQPTMPNAILMLAVNGTVPDDFAVGIRSSGQDFDVKTPRTMNWYQDGTIPYPVTFLDGAVNQTFDKNDFIYGPQSWKPFSTSGYPLFNGEDQTDPLNQYQMMFVDLKVGAVQNASLTNNGMIKVEYEFSNLSSTAVLSTYGWYMGSNHGTGIIMGNDVTTSSYMVLPVTAPPVADFTAGTTSGYLYGPIRFTDLSTNNPQSWSWDFGDGTASTLQNPSHTYSALGTYSVTLTATNQIGSNTTSKTGYITVTNPPPPVANFTADITEGVVPLAVRFNDTTDYAPIAWSWDFGDGGTSALQNPSHTYSTNGTYTVNMTVTNAAGSDTISRTAYISAISAAAPVAGLLATPVNGVSPLTVAFTDASSNYPASWSWDFGDGGTSAGQNPSHTYTAPGTYTVRLTAANPEGSSSVTKTGLVYVTTATGPLPTYHGLSVRPANHDGIKWDTTGDGTYLLPSGAAGGGLEVIHVSNDPAVSAGQVTTTNSKSGTFYATTSGTYFDDVVLLLAVNGTVPDNFAARIKTSGYTWTPTGSAPAAGSYTYQPMALDQTFSRRDLFYGPQNWKPTQGDAGYPLFAGEDMTSPVNQYQLMFIDTRAGLINDNSLTDKGAVKIEYTFTNLPDNAHFNVYGWRTSSGMGWTNALTGSDRSGYSVIPVTLPPIADFAANQTEGIAPFQVRFRDVSLNTPTRWAWDFGDGSSSTEQDPAYTYATAGTYPVTLVSTNARGSGTKTRTGYITVKAPSQTTNLFSFPGIWVETNGTAQNATMVTANSSVSGNNVTVTGIGGGWDNVVITLTEPPVLDGANWTGTIDSAQIVTIPFTVPITVLGTPNGTLSLYLTRLPNTTASLDTQITSDPATSEQGSFTRIVAAAGKQIDATAYTVNFTKSDIANAANGGIITRANISMAVNQSWVDSNGGTSHVAILHRSDDGTTTFLPTTYAGADSEGNAVFIAPSDEGLSTFVLAAVSAIPAPTTSSSSSYSSGMNSEHADAAARENAAYLAAMLATPSITSTQAVTPAPTVTTVPTPTDKPKVRITPWPTWQGPVVQQDGTPDPGVEPGTAPGAGLLNNPYILLAEAVAAIVLVTTSIVAYRRRKRDRDPLGPLR
ncbi:MAG: PKD domain-containing protein [Methanoregula sp.]|jgi:PKD repeat protein|nr:PKD domain-containing protein [Methanoregula sp.]